jgi:hypothetical protein
LEAVVEGLPGAETLGCVRPRGAGVKVPEDTVDDRAMVLPGSPGTAVVVASREERRELFPLGIGQFVAMHGGLLSW